MVTEDDARTTLEVSDRFIIEPAFAWWSRQSYLDTGATPVEEGFMYASNTNKDWLSGTKLLTMIEGSLED